MTTRTIQHFLFSYYHYCNPITSANNRYRTTLLQERCRSSKVVVDDHVIIHRRNIQNRHSRYHHDATSATSLSRSRKLPATTLLEPSKPFSWVHPALHIFPSSSSNNSIHSKNFSSSPYTSASQSRFEELNLHPSTLKALRKQGLHRLTEIQEKTYDFILKGQNVVARSRTGSGKTLAYLLPSLERVLISSLQQQQQQQEGGDDDDDNDDLLSSSMDGIQILIVVPTRELAIQIGKETEKLLVTHQQPRRSLSCQVIYGGSSKEEEIRQLESKLPTILIATTGRLKDHLATTNLIAKNRNPNINDDNRNDDDGKTAVTTTTIPFRKTLQNIQTLVLDETDRLLELGFRRDIQHILSCLPQPRPQQRQPKYQILMFSATLPQTVMDVVDHAMKATSTNNDDVNYQLVDCIQEEDPTTHTNANTEQSYVVLPTQRFWTGTMEFLLDLVEGNKDSNRSKSNHKNKSNRNHNINAKIMVFFPLTRLVQLYSKLFTVRLGMNVGRVWELHGKMNQRDRTIVARRFRNASQGILFTSDVSARGLDYPNVTHVVQVGAPPSRETYIHRLGRTGRAGKQGRGILILPDFEEDFLNELDGLELVCHDKLQQRLSTPRLCNRYLKDELGLLQQDIRSGQEPNNMEDYLRLAYHSMVAYYFQSCRNMQQSSEGVVATMNQLLQDFGLTELPAIDFQRAKSMGIDALPGLNIQKNWEDQNWNSGWMDINQSIMNDEFQRKPVGDFDDWFGVDRSLYRKRPPNKDQENNIGHYRYKSDDSAHPPSSPSSSASGRQRRPFKSKSTKKSNSRFDRFQRWEHPGEFRTS